MVAGAGLAVAVASAGADAPTTASITAKDSRSFDNGSGSSTVSVAAGGTVTFSSPSGASAHNVVFDTARPTSCTNMPATASPPGWSGSCTFAAYGTYAFHLAITLRIAVTPDAGDPFKKTLKVVLRERS